MTLKNFRPILEILALSAFAFIVHWLVFYFFMNSVGASFQFPLWMLYCFFGGCGTLITFTSIVVKYYSIDSVGQAFLLTTFIEMLLCFAVFYPKLNTGNHELGTERANFIIVFLLFLTIETVVTIRLLNKKQ